MRAVIIAAIVGAALLAALYSPRDDRIALEVRDRLTVRIPLDVWERRP